MTTTHEDVSALLDMLAPNGSVALRFNRGRYWPDRVADYAVARQISRQARLGGLLSVKNHELDSFTRAAGQLGVQVVVIAEPI